MRIISILASLLIFLAACEKNLTTETLNETPAVNGSLISSGTFQNGPYGQVTGNGQVWRTPQNNYEIVLDSFSTTNGPDLFVYLSKEVMPVNFIEVGKLKSTNGRQVYKLSSMPDLTQYKYIAIHCKAFNHLFGYTTLP